MAQERAELTIIIANGKRCWNSNDHFPMTLPYEDVFDIAGFIIYGLRNEFWHEIVTTLRTYEDSCILTIDVKGNVKEFEFSHLCSMVTEMVEVVLFQKIAKLI